MASTGSLPTLVMVPGAWHTTKHFQSCTKALKSFGFRVVVVSYPSIASPITNVGLTADTAAVRAAVLAELDLGHDIVILSHSYGGVPMSNALAGLSKTARLAAGKIGGVVRMGMATSWLLEEGKSLAETGDALARHGDAVGFVIRDDGITTVPRDPARVFFGDAHPDEAERLSSDCQPQALSTFLEKLTYAAWKEIPLSYLFCEGDKAIHPYVQKDMVAIVRGKGAVVETETSQSCHEIMSCHEDEFVAWIKRVVDKAM